MNRTCLRTTVPVLFFLCAGAAHAADWPVTRGPSHEPVPFRYDPKQWEQVPKAFLEDAPACTLYAGTSHLVDADGTIETVSHEITRLSSRKALDKLGEYRSISYTPAYEKLTLNEACVWKADGRSIPVEARHVQLRDIATDFQVYDTGKMLIISFPSLDVGDTFEVKWTVRGKNPEHHGHFFTRYTFGDDRYPVVRDELRARLPKARTLKYASTGGKIEPEIKEDGEQRTYYWKADNRAQLPQDDYLPSKEQLRLQLACSTFASWDEVLKWKHSLRKECWECTADLRRLVKEVTKDCQTPEDKARALTYWVRRHVRYLSMGEKHDYTPHTPEQVLSSRYGDCKDTSQLLAVMMKEAGIQVALATLGALDDGQVLEEVPSPWGTHAILLATINDKLHWVDTTLSLAGWDFLPHDDCNRLCYVVDDNGLRLVQTPDLRPEDNYIEQTTRLTIGPDGSSRAERSSTYRGVAAHSRRQDWVEVPVGERRRLIASELLDANSQSHLERYQIDETALKNYDAAVQARFQFEVNGHFTGEGDKEGSITDSPIWGKLLSFNLDSDRQVALDLGMPFESVHRYTLVLSPALRHEIVAKERNVRSRWGSFHLTVKPIGDRQVQVQYHTRLQKVRVEPADFDEFRKFHQEVNRYYRFWATVRPTHALADAGPLEVLLQLTPGDSASAAVLAGIYLENDKTADARRVLDRARTYQPNDQTLAELAVKAAGDASEQEAAYRELVKRFPSELRYSVALGRCLVDAGKYRDAEKVLQPVAKDGQPVEQATAHYQLARCALLENKPADALKQWEAAAAADEDTAHTVAGYLLKAKAHEKLEQSKEAAEAFREAIKIDAASAEALEGLFRLAVAAKDSAEALDALRRYSAAVGNDPAGLARAADYHLALQRYDDAFELATRAANKGSKGAARRVLGLVAFQRGKYADAVGELDQLDAEPAVLEALMRSYVALGQLDKAVRQAQRAAKVAKPTPALLDGCKLVIRLQHRRNGVLAGARVPAGRAEAYEQATERFVCAEQAYTSGIAATQVEELLKGAFADQVELGEAHALRGLLALERGRLGRAATDADKAIQAAPREARGYYVRGRVRFETGAKEAGADLAKAAELSERKDAAVLHWLAAALQKEGKTAEALAAQREAVKLKPGDAEMDEQLRELEKAQNAGQ